MAGSVQVMAHRGASKAERENTVEAFRRAAAMGADAVELDVRRTRDRALVVHHDPHLADGTVIVETDRVDLPAHVPSFDEALDACAGMWVNVEIKNAPNDPDFDPSDSIADEVMEVLVARGEAERWLISSFRMETVDRCRTIADQRGAPIRTAWLTYAATDDLLDGMAARGHAALHPWAEGVSADSITACHARGLAVNVWTVDDPDRMAELIAWQVDGICTNVPDVAVSVVAAATGG